MSQKAPKNSTQVWQQASEVYAEISQLSVKQALAHVYGIDSISIEVKDAVITLINSGSQASQYFQDKIATNFNTNLHQPINVEQCIDDYELLEELGQGGMSQVFKARRIHADSQKMVAIKIFAPQNNAAELLDLFLKEQKILADFSHPHIIDMLHGSTTETGIAYLVMALIEEALPLDKFCQNKQLTVKEKIQYIAQAADALVYSHANLIIHRDIKPENILIDKHQQLKIVDFGIAKLINNDVVGNKTTIMALTPNYAAPEQINSEAISVQTDVFSLAIVALDLLIENEQSPLPHDRLIKSCTGDQEHLDTLIKSLKIDKDLKNILHKASQVQAQHRYANMQLFCEDLNNWLANKPVKATASSWYYELSKFAKRRRALFTALVTFIVTLILAIVFQTWQYHKTLAAKQEADEVKEFMLNVFSYANPEENIGQKLSALDLLSLADEEVKYQKFSDPLIKSDILSHMGAAFVNMGGFSKGEANLLQAIKINPRNLDAQLKLIGMYLDNSDPKKAAEYFSKAQNIIKQSPQDYQQEQAQLTLLQAINSTFSKDDEKGVALAKQAKQQFMQLGNMQGVIQSSRILAEKMFNHKESQSPIELTQKVITSVAGKVSPSNTELLRLKTTMAWMYSRTGQAQQAKSTIDEVIKQLRKTLGDKHPALIDALAQRANINKDLGQMDAALKDAQQSYASAQTIFGQDSQYAQQGLSVLAQLEFVAGKRKQAQADLQKAVNLSIKNYGANHRLTLSAQMELANYMAANGDIKAAIKMAQTSRNSLIKTFGEKHPQTLFATNVLLKLLATQKVDEATIKLAVRNNQTIIKTLGIKHPQAAFSYFVLGNIYQQARLYDKANDAFKAILENQLVTDNSPRYVALTLAISKNYQAIKRNDLAIDFATKSQNAALKIFGPNAIRSIESTLFLVNLLKDSHKPPFLTLLTTLKNKVQTGEITDLKLIEQINNFE